MNENTKTDEDLTEELETDKISVSSDAKENHNSSKKAYKTLDGVSEPMVEGMTTIPNDWTAIRILSMQTDASSSNGKDVGTVKSSESVMTDVISISSGCEKIPTAINSVALMEVAEPVETHQNFTAIQHTNQEKLALEVLVEDFLDQSTDYVLFDVSKQLDTDTEMFGANIGSNELKPDGKTSTFDTTIASTTKNNEEEKLGPGKFKMY